MKRIAGNNVNVEKVVNYCFGVKPYIDGCDFDISIKSTIEKESGRIMSTVCITEDFGPQSEVFFILPEVFEALPEYIDRFKFLMNTYDDKYKPEGESFASKFFIHNDVVEMGASCIGNLEYCHVYIEVNNTRFSFPYEYLDDFKKCCEDYMAGLSGKD